MGGSRVRAHPAFGGYDDDSRVKAALAALLEGGGRVPEYDRVEAEMGLHPAEDPGPPGALYAAPGL